MLGGLDTKKAYDTVWQNGLFYIKSVQVRNKWENLGGFLEIFTIQ